VNAKNCVACHKLIPETFAKCTYCGAEQPVVSAPPPKEKRCNTCKRAYSAKLADCPYCARGMSLPPTVPTPSGLPGVPSAASLPPALRPDADDSPILSSVVLFGAPLLVGAVCGGWQWVSVHRLAEGEALGLNGPSAGLALVLAPLLAFGFVRRCHGGLADAIAAIGTRKLGGQIAAAAAVAFFPVALTLSGLLGWYNAIGASQREEELRCTVTSAFHRTKGSEDNGWHVEFVCKGASVDQVSGAIDRPTGKTASGLESGATFRIKASPGQLGWWLRDGDPAPEGVGSP
jgi:hypothetical protein